MSIHKLTLLLLLLSFWTACRKVELPPPVEESPVFAISADLDGRPFLLEAGIEEYYLFTEYREDNQGFLSFVGRWEKTSDCTSDCLESLEVEIRNTAINSGPLPFNVEQALALGTRDFFRDSVGVVTDTSLLGFEVLFENRSNSNIPLSYQWDFGDSSQASEFTPAPKFYPPSFLMDPPVVSLTVNNAINTPFIDCNLTTTRVLSFDSLNANIECGVEIDFQVMDSTMVELCAQAQGIAPFTYLWAGAGVDTSTNSDQCITVGIFDSTSIEVTVIDATGCLTKNNIVGNIDSNNPNEPLILCTTNFDYSFTQIDSVSVRLIVDSLRLGQVTLRYTDPTGDLYSTEGLSVSDQGQFEILESSGYQDNENGEATRLLKVRFDAILANGNGQLLRLENAVATMAVAYPR